MKEVGSEASGGADVEKTRRFKNGVTALGKVGAAAVLTYAGGSAAMNTVGQSDESIGPFEVRVGMKIEYDKLPLGEYASIPYPILEGRTLIEGNAMGRATADTHPFGNSVVMEPTDINLSNIEHTVMGRAGSMASGGHGLRLIEEQVRADIENLKSKKEEIALRSVLAFMGGSAGTHFLLRRRKWLASDGLVALGAANGLALAGGIGALQYDTDKLQEPKFDGLAAEARPYAMSVPRLDDLDASAMKSIGGFWAFSNIVGQEVERQQEMNPTQLRILVVSDIHQRNVFPVLKEVVKNNKIDAVLDMGDLTDWGTSQEDDFSTQPTTGFRQLKTGIADIGAPYYFIPGNHDSADTVKAVSKLNNTVTVEKNEVKVVNIKGLRLAMGGDPLFTPDSSTLRDREAYYLRGELRNNLEDTLLKRRSEGRAIDWVASHQPEVLDDLADYPSLSSNGHKHTYSLSYDEDYQTWRYQEGSTGGSGLRMARPSGEETDELPTPDQQQFSIVHIGSDCRPTKIEHFSYNIFSDKGSEYFVEKFEYENETYGTERCLQKEQP